MLSNFNPLSSEAVKADILPYLLISSAGFYTGICLLYTTIPLLSGAYLGQLHNQGVRGVSLGTTNLNLEAIHLYEKFNFQLLEKRNSRYWTRITGQMVENLRYGIKFN